MELYTKDNYNGYYLAIEEKIDKTYPLTGEISRKEVFDELGKLTEGNTELINDYIDDPKYVKSSNKQNDLVVIQIRMVGEEFDGEFDWCVTRLLYDIVEHKLFYTHGLSNTKRYKIDEGETFEKPKYFSLCARTQGDINILHNKLKQKTYDEEYVFILMNNYLHYGIYIFDDYDDFLKNHKKGDNGLSVKNITEDYSYEGVGWYRNVIECLKHFYKDCEDCFDCSACEGCKECYKCRSCEDCEGCEKCNRSENLTDCKDCTYCVGCDSCTDCEYCNDCVECNDCHNCKNCEDCETCDGCVNKKNQTNKKGKRKKDSNAPIIIGSKWN